MDENYEVLKVYCDKQKIMIADLFSKLLMLETKLEILQAQMRNSPTSQEDSLEKDKSINKEEIKSKTFGRRELTK